MRFRMRFGRTVFNGNTPITEATRGSIIITGGGYRGEVTGHRTKNMVQIRILNGELAGHLDWLSVLATVIIEKQGAQNVSSIEEAERASHHRG